MLTCYSLTGYFKQASAFGLEVAYRCLAAERGYWRSFICTGGGEDGGGGLFRLYIIRCDREKCR